MESSFSTVPNGETQIAQSKGLLSNGPMRELDARPFAMNLLISSGKSIAESLFRDL